MQAVINVFLLIDYFLEDTRFKAKGLKLSRL